ncbi:MAG: MYXO-CTERM sorting domain-containing protein [Myxococcota bacterium]|nr:MYXO-CTERM sorting domain-containing protein [Myxococcota bacterium]
MLSLVFIFAMGACGNFGGCGACGSVGALPADTPQTLKGVPRDQTVEGGAQIRVTPQGFTKISAAIKQILNQSLAGGFCVPRGEVGNCDSGFLSTGACYCAGNAGPGCNPGCKANVQINQNGFNVTPVGNELRVDLSLTLSTQIVIKGRALGISLGTCTLNVTSPNLNGSFNIGLGIKAVDGELDLRLARINAFQLNLDISGCGFLGDLADIVGNLIDAVNGSFINQFVFAALTPVLNNIIQGLLPNPLGLAGMTDIGSLLEGVSPGTDGFMEARMVPGGYADVINGGVSLGVITGLNADEDPSTRTAGLTSEPHLCVPPIPAPNFAIPPAQLPLSGRNTFRLDRAGAFTGGAGNEPNADLAMGISETTLDLAGHHLVTSGGMCLGVGTSFINQLNVSTIGLLVPSVADLGSDEGNDPLLLVTRPQRALDFTIGNNTPTSPAVTIHIRNMEVDFYAFLYERYVRVFTMELTMNVGINLDFQQMPGMPAQIVPSLVGISSSEVQVKVLNKEFVKETQTRLEMVLPSVFDLVTPLLGQLPPIDVPTFAGFSLSNLSIQKVTTSQDDFLAIYASLGAAAMLKKPDAMTQFDAALKNAMQQQLVATGIQSTGQARLANVDVPDVAIVRRALTNEPQGRLPEVVFEVDRVDSSGRELEWTYNLNGGMFHQWQPGGTFRISDRAFAWQGKYLVGLKSRVVGDYTSTSATIETPVVIDSVGPNILEKKAEWDGNTWNVPLWDIVSGKHTQYAFARPGDADPKLEWVEGGMASISRDALKKLAENNEVLVYAKDELGNQTVALVAPFHGQSGGGGCSCETTGGPSTGSIALFVIVGFMLVGRRRSIAASVALVKKHQRAVANVALWVGLSTVLSLVPGCSCGSNSDKSCETVADCGPDFCPPGEIPYCIDNTCVCSDDIIIGRVGPYSDVAVATDGSIWVSAYAQSYGDLVVTKAIPGRIPDESWEWVDGVPDGPVVVEGSLYRNGIAEKGEDVGMYTSIGVGADGGPMVTYFDRDKASLKFAHKGSGGWEIHTIEEGSGELGEFSGELVGMYTAITLRSDDGRPGVAYLAHIADANGTRAEVRFAAAQTQFPQSAGDWQTWVVDQAPLPPVDPNNPEIYPLPRGLGLFLDVARLPNNAPVVVYYDRSKGDLKMSKFNVTTGQFDAPKLLDGSGNIDAGWSPSIAVGPDGKVRVAYVAATGDDLKFIVEGTAPEIVDDGYRVVGVTVDNLPKPEFHFVGEDAGLVLANNGQTPMIAYQDATTQELLLTEKRSDNTWARNSVAGHVEPWPGAYGFFAATAVTATEIVMSTWVINQPTGQNWVEVFKRPTALQ